VCNCLYFLDHQLLIHLIWIRMAQLSEDDIIQTNVTGFICVYCVSYNSLNKKFNLVVFFSHMNNRNNLDLERQIFKVFSSQPRSLSRTRYFLFDIQHMNYWTLANP
jgi:polyribonucleotide 5'-hydroxyl-kinase